jgi:hypothetical protein
LIIKVDSMTNLLYQPLFLSPTPPSDLLQFVVNHCSHPTVLLICASRTDFLFALANDIVSRQRLQHEQPQHQHNRQSSPTPDPETLNSPATEPSHQTHAIPPEDPNLPSHIDNSIDQQEEPYLLPDDEDNNNADPSLSPSSSRSTSSQPPSPSSALPPHPYPPQPPLTLTNHPLLTPTLAQLSTTRHIRTLFIPTVSHLRAVLSVLSSSSPTTTAAATITDTKSPSVYQPYYTDKQKKQQKGTKPSPPPLLLVYNLLALHRDTSEWSAQGISTSAAALVEAADREGWRGVVCELPRARARAQEHAPDEEDGGRDGDGEEGMATMSLDDLLAERVPILSGSARPRGVAGELLRKTVDVRTVLARWFRFRDGTWWDGELE